MAPVIKVENLSKKYTISHQNRQRYIALRDVITDKFIRLRSKLSRPFNGSVVGNNSLEEFWALRDINFEVKQGERIGVIGRNGAGKTTLLKILSRITEPTKGRVSIKGRVASLLEVGTGFHQELTGRENIYLSGAILGMNKAEINKKFDQIVEFAGVEKFMDVPVKRYSSGMYVRLAFSVAAHLDQEILLVDEVLAVGDLAFQKKCLGKMESVSKEGRTLLFVSHNLQAIRNLCPKTILVSAGRLVEAGPSSQIIELYLSDAPRLEDLKELNSLIKKLPPDPAFRLESINIFQEGNPTGIIANSLPLVIEIEYSVLQKTTGLRVAFDLCDTEGTRLIRSFHDEDAAGVPTMEPGHYLSKAVIPDNFLGPIRYDICVHAGIFNVRSCLPGEEGLKFTVEVENTGKYNRAYVNDTFRAKLAPAIVWVTQKN